MAVVLMLSLVIASFLQVILRNFFSIGFGAVEELMRNDVLWITFVGAVLTTMGGRHISIDILPRYLKEKPKRILNWILAISASVICLILAWYSVQFVRLDIEMKSIIAGFCPEWIFETIIPVGFFLLAISFPIRQLDEGRKGLP